MTKQDWDTLQKYYDDRIFGSVRLQVGDFSISLQKEVTKNKVVHMIWVNGLFKGQWLNTKNPTPETQFMYKKKKVFRTHSDAELKTLRKLFGAEKAKIFEPTVIIGTTPYFPSFTAFKKQMIATGLPISTIAE